MFKLLILPVLFVGASLAPVNTVDYQKTDDPLQSYCLMAKADAAAGVSMGENVKALCN